MSSTPTDPSEAAADRAAFQLHLEEYRALRTEITDLQRLRITTAQFGIGGIVAIWAFLLTLDVCNIPIDLARVGWFLPALVAGGCYVISKNATSSIQHGGAYLAMIEQVYANRDLAGWHVRAMQFRAQHQRSRPAAAKGTLEGLDAIPEPKDARVTPILKVLEDRSRNARVSTTLVAFWLVILYVSVLVGGVVMLKFDDLFAQNCSVEAQETVS